MNKLINKTPEDLKVYLDMADRLSKADLVPAAYKGKPNNILVAIQWGMELGLSPMRSLQSIAIINGKASMYGDELLAMVKSHPAFLGIHEEVKNDVATCTIKRDVRGKEEVTTRTFSKEDAVTSKLWKKPGPWTQYPQVMLKHRARGFALRDAFPDAIKGIITYEELRDYPQDNREEQVIPKITSKDTDIDAIADQIEQSQEVQTQELKIPGKESKTFSSELDWSNEFASILISVTQYKEWDYATKRQKIDNFVAANKQVLDNLSNEMQIEMNEKIANFYKYVDEEETWHQESMSARADEMHPEEPEHE